MTDSDDALVATNHLPTAATTGAALTLLARCCRALLRVAAVALVLTLALTVLRIVQTTYYAPTGWHGLAASEVGAAWWRGLRFDLKVSTTAALLLLPLLFTRSPRPAWIAGTVVGAVFLLLGVINFHYFGFYKTPIDALVFGLFEDDTQAVLETIVRDFNVAAALAAWLLLTALAALALRPVLRRGDALGQRLARPLPLGLLCVALGLLSLLFAAKGTWRGMALQKQHLGVTTSAFLNAMVSNGVIALKYAQDERRLAHDFSDDEAGVRAMGFASVQQAADAYGLQATGREAIARALIAQGAPAAGPRRNLAVLQMESWSAEPLHYQAPGFDMLGRLAPLLQQAYLFTSFDSAQDGTHPSLEAILFGTPITPLTQGPNGRRPIPWSVARVLKQAGYDTVFATSGQSGWRDLNRVLLAQGFDEVVDAATLRKLYPQAQGGIWGVWDDYLFDYIRHRLATQPVGRPIFIYGMSTTNHPPYELPAGYQPPSLDMTLWRGEASADSLHDNLVSYRYVNDRFGQFLEQLGADGTLSQTVVAATGDHNVRSFGVYATPERQPLKHRVPFVVWAGPGLCRDQLALPASHRDMFPTLLPLVGVGSGYLRSGRNLFDCAGPAAGAGASDLSPRALSFAGDVRNVRGVWRLGQPRSFVCAATAPTPANDCRFPHSDDVAERAYWALMDWNVRAALKTAPRTGPTPAEKMPP